MTVTGGLVAVTYGLAGASGSGWTSLRTLGPLLAGVALLGLFALLQTRVSVPLVRPGILSTAILIA